MKTVLEGGHSCPPRRPRGRGTLDSAKPREGVGGDAGLERSIVFSRLLSAGFYWWGAAKVGGLLQRPPSRVRNFPFMLNLRGDPEHFLPMRKPGAEATRPRWESFPLFHEAVTEDLAERRRLRACRPGKPTNDPVSQIRIIL